MSEDDLPLDREALEVSAELFMLLNNWVGDHPGEPLTLTYAQVCDLAGCAGEEEVQRAAEMPDSMRSMPDPGLLLDEDPDVALAVILGERKGSKAYAAICLAAAIRHGGYPAGWPRLGGSKPAGVSRA